MMAALRYCLIVFWAIILIFLAYNLASDWRSGGVQVNWPAYPVGAFFLLNIAYLIICKPAPFRWGQTRISRLVGLWFDAKETELRKRAEKSENSN
jgi:hypothetical protein